MKDWKDAVADFRQTLKSVKKKKQSCNLYVKILRKLEM
nr:hypothetical protein [Bacillus velezensis]